MSFYDEYKHTILTAISGFLGALVLVGNSKVKTFYRGAVIAVTGILCAVFLTPLVSQLPLLKDLGVITNQRSDFAVSFLIGTTGWAFVLTLQQRFLSKISDKDENNGAD